VELPLKNTNEWIWNHPAFGAWGKAGGVLWITGKPGSGKSTIARMITERLVPSPEPNADACDVPGASRSLPSVVASFFYSSRLGATAMGHDYMLRSILYQVLTQNQALYRHFQSTYRKLIQEQYGLSTWHFRNSGQDDRDQINEALNLLQHKDLPVSWTIEALENVFENIAEEIEANQTKIYCILDGFDESDEGSVSVSWQNESMSVRRRTLYWLTELSLRKVAVDWLRVIVLSRPTADIKFAQAGFNNIIVEEHNGPAIEKIVNYRLTSISRTMRKWESVHSGQNLDRSSPNLESWEDYPGPTLTTLRSIRAQILKRANHTILWVVLVLKELEFTLGKSGVYSLEDVDKTLKSLPEGLEELYKELISRLCARRSKAELLKARHMIMWACFAKRPLSLLEFQDAVAATSWTGPSDLSFAEHLNRNRVQLFNQTNFAPIEQDIINSCGCLLEVVKLGYRYQDGDVVLTFKVQITHQTVLDLVLRQDRSAEPFYWSRDEAENQISSAIHHYLVHCTETRSCLPEPEMGSSFVQDGIMPLFNHVHCHQLLNYILQNRHCGSVPIWQANDPIPLTMRNLTHTLPGPQKHSAGHEDINIYITSMLNSMEQARKQWNRSNFNIWSNAPADPNDKSRPKKGSSRLGTELVFSKPSNMYTGNEIFSPRTEPSPKFAMAVAANFPRHNATLQARDTAVHLSPGESRASSRSPVQTSDMTESSSRNSPSNDHRQTRARCYKCRQRGHLVKNCPQRARRPISRNT
jgi:energy-coupling factor transporter ATP-binding protein EcfA2